MSEELRKQLGLPPMDQVGFVYRNLEEAMEKYDAMFGPWEIQEYGSFDYEYRGEEEPAELRIAFGKSGDIEIELIQWVSGGCPHKEFIDAGNEGMHHLRFLVDNVDDMVARAKEIGWQTVWYKQFGPGLAMAYMERPNDPLLIEFFENQHG